MSGLPRSLPRAVGMPTGYRFTSSATLPSVVSRRPSAAAAAGAAAPGSSFAGQLSVLTSGSSDDVLPFRWGFTVGSVRTPELEALYRAILRGDEGLVRGSSSSSSQQPPVDGNAVRAVDGPNPWSSTKPSRDEVRAIRENNHTVKLRLDSNKPTKVAFAWQQQQLAAPAEPTTDAVAPSPPSSPAAVAPLPSDVAQTRRHSVPVQGPVSMTSIRASRTERFLAALDATKWGGPAPPGVSDDEMALVRDFLADDQIKKEIDGEANVLADLVTLTTLDAELETLDPSDDAEARQELLALFAERYVALSIFTGPLRKATLKRLFALGLLPTVDLGMELLDAAFSRPSSVPSLLREANAILNQLTAHGVGKNDPREREALLLAFRQHRQLDHVRWHKTTDTLAIDAELDQIARGVWVRPAPRLGARRRGRGCAGSDGQAAEGETTSSTRGG